MKDEDSENKNLYVKPPSLFKMLKTFTGETANFIKAGAPVVTKEDYADRLDSCMKCEHLQKKHMKCGLCGCMLQFKARMKTTDCPDRPSRWKEQVLDDKR
jgi:hypothetical protein|tara:strand:+ start:882 stop:1181 length:300 start_codon:yes stop_codon:yes gene_type:complete